MLLQGITWGTSAILKWNSSFPEMICLLWGLVNLLAFPFSPLQAHGKVASPCSPEIRSGHVTSCGQPDMRGWWLELVWLVGAPSLAGVTTNVTGRRRHWWGPWVRVTGAGCPAKLGWAWSTSEKSAEPLRFCGCYPPASPSSLIHLPCQEKTESRCWVFCKDIEMK